MKLTRSASFAAAVAAALVAAAPAAASPAGKTPTTKASGDPVAIVPSLIQTRITRVNNAIDRLTDYVDDNDVAGVDRTGKVMGEVPQRWSDARRRGPDSGGRSPSLSAA